MLNKQFRIKDKKDYNELYKTGRRLYGKYIVVYIKSNELSYDRFGIVTSKKVGTAVVRNRIKRQIRAIIQTWHKEPGNEFKDVVIVAKRNIDESIYSMIQKDLIGVLRKAGLCLKI